MGGDPFQGWNPTTFVEVRPFTRVSDDDLHKAVMKAQYVSFTRIELGDEGSLRVLFEDRAG